MRKGTGNVSVPLHGKVVNITDSGFQKIIYAARGTWSGNRYPSVEGIKDLYEKYDSLEMRKHKPEEFYDDSILREVDKNGLSSRSINERAGAMTSDC